MITKVRCALTISDWSRVMHVIQKDSEAQRKDGYPPGGALDKIFMDLCTQLNAPDFIEIPEPGEKPEGKNWKVPGITPLPDTKTASDFAGGMENCHCWPDPEEQSPPSEHPGISQGSDEETHALPTPGEVFTKSDVQKFADVPAVVDRDDDGDVIPPKINLPM